MVLAYKPSQPSSKALEEPKKSDRTVYSASVGRSATTLGTASTTIEQDYIATYINFTGYVEAFDNDPKTRTYVLTLNGITLMSCTVANASPTTEYQDKANETIYLPNIKVRKGSIMSIICGGSTGNVNSGSFTLGGHLE